MLAAKDFAILPWDWPTGGQEMFDQIRACGFNLAGFVKPEQLDHVQQAGLEGFVFDPHNHVGDAEAELEPAEITRRVEGLVKRVGGHPAAFGYYLRDEPGARVYPGLRKWAETYKQAAPGALAYINLFPNYASPSQMNTETYAEYLESFLNVVQPRYVSYDHYAMMDDGSLRGGYFANLEAVRAAALRHGIPFWNIVLANAHFHYAEPSPATLRFQLYTTLAYGARGISYFTYFAPKVGNYRLAPIDQFGNPTPTWEMLRNVNLQLHKLGPVYIGLKSLHVFHHPNVPHGCAGIETSRLVARLEGDELLVGEFEDGQGRPYALAVNKSLHRSTSFDLQFKQAGPVHVINAYTGQAEPWAGEQIWLAPGQGMLLGVD
jgi:hypothetical protein